MSKPFFYRIEAGALLDFATDPEGEGVTLLRFAKDLQKGCSDIPFIQAVIDEASNYIEKKRISGAKGGLAKASGAKAVLENAIAEPTDAVAKPSTPLASSSSSTETEDSKPLAPSRKNDSPPKVEFDYSTGKFTNIHAVMINLWQDGFPAINIGQEINKAAAWAMANPKNRKSNWPKFLTNWFLRAQDRAGRVMDTPPRAEEKDRSQFAKAREMFEREG